MIPAIIIERDVDWSEVQKILGGFGYFKYLLVGDRLREGNQIDDNAILMTRSAFEKIDAERSHGAR
jgi:hypothetical protein